MLRASCSALLVALLTPTPSFSWGAVAHRHIAGRAIDLLPPELEPFFAHCRDELGLRSNDPDLWRQTATPGVVQEI